VGVGMYPGRCHTASAGSRTGGALSNAHTRQQGSMLTGIDADDRDVSINPRGRPQSQGSAEIPGIHGDIQGLVAKDNLRTISVPHLPSMAQGIAADRIPAIIRPQLRTGNHDTRRGWGACVRFLRPAPAELAVHASHSPSPALRGPDRIVRIGSSWPEPVGLGRAGSGGAVKRHAPGPARPNPVRGGPSLRAAASRRHRAKEYNRPGPTRRRETSRPSCAHRPGRPS
jgi:hypothetical protein